MKSSKYRFIHLLLLGALTIPFSTSANDQPMILDGKLLAMDAAAKIAKVAIDQCRKEGVQVAVTIVDRSGHPLIMMRDTLAMDLSIPISRAKAYTSVVFNMPSSELDGRFPRDSVGKFDGVIVARGGLPINAGGYILGGVGVSGAPSGKTDEACAKAGLKAVMDDLEMSF